MDFLERKFNKNLYNIDVLINGAESFAGLAEIDVFDHEAEYYTVRISGKGEKAEELLAEFANYVLASSK